MFDSTLDEMLFNLSSDYKNLVAGPAYDVTEKDDKAIISVAVPGVEQDDLSVKVNPRTKQLSISYNQSAKQERSPVVTKPFNLKFNVSDTAQVDSATCKNGILSVVLKTVIPDDLKERVIPISNGSLTEKQLLTEQEQ